MSGIPLVCPLGHTHKGNGFCIYTGKYRAGLFHGQGEFRCISGQWYKGNWCDGKRHGQVCDTVESLWLFVKLIALSCDCRATCTISSMVNEVIPSDS